jgi:hypothetical protein
MFHFGECGRRRLGKFDPGFAGEPVDFSRSRENGHDDNRPRVRRLPGATFAMRAVRDEWVTQRSYVTMQIASC